MFISGSCLTGAVLSLTECASVWSSSTCQLCKCVAKSLVCTLTVLMKHLHMVQCFLRVVFSRARLHKGKPLLFRVLLQSLVIIHSSSLSVTQGKLQEDLREHPVSVTPPPQKFSSEERKQRWEAGQMDYMGDDSFANIERKLDSFLK